MKITTQTVPLDTEDPTEGTALEVSINDTFITLVPQDTVLPTTLDELNLDAHAKNIIKAAGPLDTNTKKHIVYRVLDAIGYTFHR